MHKTTEQIIAHFGPKNVKISKNNLSRNERTIFKAPPIWYCRVELLQRSVARLRPLSLGQNGSTADLLLCPNTIWPADLRPHDLSRSAIKAQLARIRSVKKHICNTMEQQDPTASVSAVNPSDRSTGPPSSHSRSAKKHVKQWIRKIQLAHFRPKASAHRYRSPQASDSGQPLSLANTGQAIAAVRYRLPSVGKR